MSNKTPRERAAKLVVKWDNQHDCNAIGIVRLHELRDMIATALEEAEQRGRAKPWPDVNEAKLDNLVYKWLVNNDWDYKKYGDKRTNREAYQTLMFYEVSELLHNSLVAFSRHLLKEHAAPVPSGLSEGEIEEKAKDFTNGAHLMNTQKRICCLAFQAGYKAALGQHSEGDG